jgi:hypothetical protein
MPDVRSGDGRETPLTADELVERIPCKDQRDDFARAARAAMLYVLGQIEASAITPTAESNGRVVSVAGEVFGLH